MFGVGDFGVFRRFSVPVFTVVNTSRVDIVTSTSVLEYILKE
jgi:hypothetical protein